MYSQAAWWAFSRLKPHSNHNLSTRILTNGNGKLPAEVRSYYIILTVFHDGLMLTINFGIATRYAAVTLIDINFYIVAARSQQTTMFPSPMVYWQPAQYPWS